MDKLDRSRVVKEILSSIKNRVVIDEEIREARWKLSWLLKGRLDQIGPETNESVA